MNEQDTGVPVRGSRMRIPRTRGAASGFLLILLGAWGALIPFVGPYFNFAYTPDQEWIWTEARGWLEVLPGAVTAVGGLLLLTSGHRATAMLGGWLTVLAGAWFVVGRALAGPLGLGDPGSPVAMTDNKRLVLELAYFSALGAVIVFFGALALGRVSVRSLRDVQHAHRSTTTPEPAATEAATETEPEAPAKHAVTEGGTSEAGAGETAASDTASETSDTASETEERPRRQGFGGLFRSRREKTTTTR